MMFVVTLLTGAVANAKTAADYASAPAAGAFYLYSTGQNKFLNTSVNAPGLIALDGTPVATTLTDNGDGTFLMSGVSGKFLKLGVYRGQYLWSDADGTNAYTKWTFTLVADKKYQISSVEGNYSEGSITGTWYISGTNATDVAANADAFYLVSEEQLEGFCQQMPIDAAKAELAGLMEQAETLGVSTADAKAVYDSETATLEEVNAAIEALNNAIRAAQESVATPANPQDVTNQYILNSTFEQNFNGWTSDTGAKNNQIQKNDGLVGEGGVTDKFWENWKGSAFNGRMYTEINDLPNGIYAFTLGAFDNGGGAYVYANQDSVAVEKYEDGGKAKLYTVITMVDNATMEAGLKTFGSVTTWMGIDNAKLMFMGSALESYRYWYENYKKSSTYGDETLCQKTLYAQYKAAKEAVEAATTKEDIVAAIAALRDVEAQLKANVAAYAALGAAMEEADLVLSELTYKALDDYYEQHMNDAQNGLLTTEEMLAVVARMNELIEEARKQGTAVGGDMTGLLTNPDFTDGLAGWTYGAGTLKTGGNGVNPMAESWQTNFNMYQELSGLNEGVYQLDFSGFGRHSGYETSWAERQQPVVMAYAYMNGSETAVKDYSADATTDATLYTSPYTIEETYYLPNNLADVARGMNSGLYKNTVYGIVTNGTLRLGLYSDNMGTDCWVAWDSFRLTYQGKDATVLTKALPVFATQMKRYEQETMSAAVKNALKTAIQNSETAATGTGEQMFEAYATMEAMITTVKASIAAYEALSAAAEELNKVFSEFSEQTSQATRQAANALIDQLKADIPAGKYTDDEAKAMIETIEEMMTALRTPAGIDEASDNNPVNMTSRIVNASFNNNNDEGWSGTPMAHQTVQAAEVFNKNFNVYQTITGLPEGTYEVGVTGFYRNGWNRDDVAEPYRRYLEGETPNALFYTVTAEGESTVPLTAMWAEATLDSVQSNGVVKIESGETVFFVPNSMTAAVAYFNEGHYKNNSLLVKVTDGTLTIGLKKETEVANDWTMFDDFRLTYYGKNSQKTTGIGDAVRLKEKGEMRNEKCYDLQGRRVAKPTKGLYIIGGRKVIF